MGVKSYKYIGQDIGTHTTQVNSSIQNRSILVFAECLAM